MPNLASPRTLLLCSSLLSSALVGCSSRTNPDAAIASVNTTNLQRLANLYFTYQSQHDWQGPANENDFKSFLRGYPEHMLTRIGVDPSNIDKLFISERDGQPFKIRYGVPGSSMGSSAPVIFEATGDGKGRLVGFLNMEQREVDDSEYKSLWTATAAPKPQRETR